MLQELCPRCGNEWIDDRRPCPACGYEPVVPRGPAGVGTRGRSIAVLLGVAAAAVVAVVIVSGPGLRPPAPLASPSQPTSQLTERAALPAAPRLGRVLFGQRLATSMELEWRQSQFASGDTIAWRAEFTEPPRAAELTVVIAWQSHRERMELSRDTVTLAGAGLTTVVRDEVPIDELVPTAGLYAVTYFAGDAKLAEGVFEVLPPDR